MKFKFIPHTADIKFQAFGKNLEECFENSAYAMVNVICKQKIKSIEKRKIKVSGIDRENLLYNFLEEFLYLFEVTGFLLSEIKNLSIVGFPIKKGHKKFYNLELNAELLGDNVKNYNIELQVKSATYNDMFITYNDKTKKFISQVVLDI